MNLLTAYDAVAATVASSLYGWLQGAWPFGVVDLVWPGVALWRWWSLR